MKCPRDGKGCRSRAHPLRAQHQTRASRSKPSRMTSPQRIVHRAQAVVDSPPRPPGKDGGSGIWTPYAKYGDCPARGPRHRIRVAEARYTKQVPATFAPGGWPEPPVSEADVISGVKAELAAAVEHSKKVEAS